MRKLVLLFASTVFIAGFASAQSDDVTTEQIVQQVYASSSSKCKSDCADAKKSNKDNKKCAKSNDKKNTCKKCSTEDEYLPISRDDAETLITKMIVEARAPYTKAREQYLTLKRFKVETLKRRLLDKALRDSYLDEYKERIDRLERLLTTVILANSNGKVDPTVLSTLLSGKQQNQEVEPSTLVPETNTITTIVEGVKTENFLSQVFFDLAKSNLKPQAISTLDGVVEWMKENSSVRMSLRGFASPEGNLKFNNALSMKRVKAVSDYLVSKGISRDRLDVTPSGIDSVTETWPEARRVDIRPVLCD